MRFLSRKQREEEFILNRGINKLNIKDIKSLREIVFEHLRNAILDGTLLPGERLMEVQLADKLGVSRTPIREAIRKLELEGLVEMIPRRGAQVSDLSVKDVADVLEVRETLEGLAASLAAVNMSEEELKELEKAYIALIKSVEEKNIEKIIRWDSRFHDVLLSASKNPRLVKVNAVLIEQVHRFRKSYIEDITTAKYIVHSHKKILDALKSRDPEISRACAIEHIREVKEFILDKYKKKAR